jgi:hypothetical protein
MPSAAAGTTRSTGVSPAFAQLDDDQLTEAVALAERVMREGDPLLRQLNAQSLSWRGKL